ncbi:hypothetical protein [Mycobacterium sp. 050134]|uniref:hypothetical protein n=1 Tax=Mycobacterium sp. 050134 TaxID=3096111 RepID=UPI002ED985B6
MTIGQEPPPAGEEDFIADEIEVAEDRARRARERAAQAGFSAADSLEESARRHEHFAEVEDEGVRQGVPHTDVHRESARLHRKAAAEDRHLAELKRRESEADLS